MLPHITNQPSIEQKAVPFLEDVEVNPRKQLRLPSPMRREHRQQRLQSALKIGRWNEGLKNLPEHSGDFGGADSSACYVSPPTPADQRTTA